MKRYLNKENYFKTAVFIFILTLPLWRNLNTWVLPVLIMSWLNVSSLTDKKKQLKNHKISLLYIYSLFLFIFLSVIHDFPKHDLLILVKYLGFLLIPLVFLSVSAEKIKIRFVFIALGTGLLIAMISSWGAVLYSIFDRPANQYLKQSKYFFQWIYTGKNLLKPIDIHPSYFGVMLTFFIVALFFENDFSKLRNKKLLFFILSFLFLLFLLEITSRVAFLSFLLILLIMFFKKNTQFKIASIFFIFFIFFIGLQFDFFNKKINTIFQEERYFRWIKILSCFFNDKKDVILGWGHLNAEKNYIKAYQAGGFELARTQNYNAHNQYLEFFFRTGLFGLLFYIKTLKHFIQKTKLKNSAMFFLVIIIVFSFGESFLERNKGIFFFTTFYSILINNYAFKKTK